MVGKSIVALLCLLGLASAVTIKLTVLSGITFPTPIGIDYQESSKKLILSVNYPSGTPTNLELLSQNGSFTGFSSLSGLTDELKIATVRSGVGVTQGGFTLGDVFTGNGNGGQIVRVSADGSSVQNPWITLPSEGGLIRGSLYVDRVGTFGGDLIVCTTAGGVWRITSGGVPTKLAQLGVHLEGLVVVPNDPTKFGFLAGKIVAGAEGQHGVHIIDNVGQVNSFINTDFAIEDLDVIDGNFYGVNFGTSTILAAPATQFAGLEGQILATQEFPTGGNDAAKYGLALLSWDAANSRPKFTRIDVSSDSDRVDQWEHVTFAPIGVTNIPPNDFPGCENKHSCSENSVQTSTNGKEICICFDSTPCPQ